MNIVNWKACFHRGAIGVAMLCLGLCVLCPSLAYADACPKGGEHAYEVTIPVVPSETSEGLRLFTCTKCGDTYEQIMPATGHQWGPWIVDLEPTCTSPGHQYRVCEQYPQNPHYEEQEIPALSSTGEHPYVLVEDVPSTCTDAGYRLHVCSICGDSYTEELYPFGHEWGEWVVDQEPTVTEEGRRMRVCAHDSTHVEYEAIPVLEAPEEEPPPVKAAEPKEVPQVVEPEPQPEKPDLFFSGPNTFDAIAMGIDLTALVVFLILAIPLIRQMAWIKKRRHEARERFLDTVREGKGNLDDLV